MYLIWKIENKIKFYEPKPHSIEDFTLHFALVSFIEIQLKSIKAYACKQPCLSWVFKSSDYVTNLNIEFCLLNQTNLFQKQVKANTFLNAFIVYLEIII